MICRMDFDMFFGILIFEPSSHHNVAYDKLEELSKGSGPSKSGLARARSLATRPEVLLSWCFVCACAGSLLL